MFTHKHAKRTRPTVELKHGQMQTIYVIETDLAVTPDDPAFDEVAFTDLVEQATEYLASRNATYETIRIESIRGQ